MRLIGLLLVTMATIINYKYNLSFMDIHGDRTAEGASGRGLVCFHLQMILVTFIESEQSD